MKKILIAFILFFLLLFESCGVSNNNENVVIQVENEIEIDKTNYTSSFSWDGYIRVYVDEVEKNLSALTVTQKEPGFITGERYKFSAIYKYNEKNYEKEFYVIFVENKIKIQVITYDSKKIIKTIDKGESVDLSDINTTVSGYNFMGWYTDNQYKNELTNTHIFNNSTSVYGKWTKDTISYQKPNQENLVVNMLEYTDSLMQETPDYKPAWNQESFKARWNYIDGVFLKSIVELYNQTNDKSYMDFVVRYINYYIDPFGYFIDPVTQERTGFKSGELDSICESLILFDVYEYTNDMRYKYAIENTYKELIQMPKTSNGINYAHKITYPNQIWLDGMYMYAPFFAKYAKMKNLDYIFNDLTNQYRYIRDNMYDENKNLYYHGHDTTKNIFWSNNLTGNSSSFWLRSMGWYIVSLVDVLEYYPEGTNKTYLIGLLDEAIKGILEYQDENSKLFFQLIDLGPTGYVVSGEYLQALNNENYSNNGSYEDTMIFNYLETSGSSMVAYSLLKAARQNYISNDYKARGEEIYESIYSNYFINNNLDNICITAGLGPENNIYRDGSISYYLSEPVGSNDAKGVGPFLMAFLEYSLVNDIDIKSNKCTITIDYLGSSTEVSAVKTTNLSSYLVKKDIYKYKFIGFYYDEDHSIPVKEDDIVVDDIVIYAYYINDEKNYEYLENLDNTTTLIKDNFDSYNLNDKLDTFSGWNGITGIYSHINDKNNDGVDTNSNYIELGGNDAHLKDTSTTDGTQLITQMGKINSGILYGYMEIKLYNSGNQWTFFQLYGSSTEKTNTEVFGIRIMDGILKYRIYGSDVLMPLNHINYRDDCAYKIYFEVNLDNSTITVLVDDLYFVNELYIPSLTEIIGTKVVTSDSLAYVIDSSGNKIEFHRTAKVDNLIFVKKN